MANLVSPRYNMRTPRQSQRIGRQGRGQQNLLTESDKELLPFINVAKQEREQEANRMNPLQIVLNLLQTPNYMSANVVDAIWDGVRDKKDFGQIMKDTVGGLFKGLTWQDTRTFKDVIEGNVAGSEDEDWWTSPMLGDKYEGKFIRGATPAGTLGFLGDIFLDPTTYLSFGSTAAARQAAKNFAEDTVKLSLSRMTAKELAEVAGEGISEKVIKRIAGKSKNYTDDVYRYLSKNSDGFARYMDNIVKEAERTAIRNPEQVLKTQLKSQFDDILERTPEEFRGGLQEIGETIAQKNRYAGAGEHASRFMGKTILKGQRQNFPIARTLDVVGDSIRKSKAGHSFTDAWWSAMNKGPIGLLRKTFGVRSPYKQILNLKERNATALMEANVYNLTSDAGQFFKGLGEDLSSDALYARSLAERAYADTGEGTVLGVRDILKQKDNYPELAKLSDEQVNRISHFWDGMDKMFKQMRDREMELVEKGVIDDFGEIINYIPKYHPGTGMFKQGKELGSKGPGYTKETTFTMMDSMEQGIAKLKLMYGDILDKIAAQRGISVDEVASRIVRDKNWTEITPASTSLPEMIEHRIVAHGRAIQRGELIEQFKPFGINVKGLGLDSQEAVAALTREGANLANLGLVGVKDPAFKDYLFDKEVANIIDKVYSVTANDDAVKTWQKLANQYTSWWKTVVTSTPGFHSRNMLSNTMTGFLRHGPQWFAPKNMVDSTVATMYALNPGSFTDDAQKLFGLTQAKVNQILSKTRGDFTLRELADYAREKGVISSFSYQGKLEKTIGKTPVGKRISMLSPDFEGYQISKKVGNYVENSARMESFLLSYDEVMESVGERAAQGTLESRAVQDEIALSFATQDAKRWFIDYGDLTDAEKKIAKLVPFYTWIRKNLANQINGMTMYPEMYRLIPKTTKAIAQDEDFDYELQPEWQKHLGMIPVGEDPETGKKLMFFPNFPYLDINKIPLSFGGEDITALFNPRFEWGELRDEFASSAHPVVKSVVEVMTNSNTFKRRKMFDRVRAPGLVQYFTNSPEMIGVLDGLARTIGFENGIRVNERSGKVEMDEKMERLLSANLPVIRTLEKWMDLTEQIPVIEAAIESATGKKSDYEGLEDFFQNLSYFGGIKFKTFDEDYYKQQRARELQEKAEKMRKEYRKSLPGYQKRSSDYWKNVENRRKRLGLYGP